MAGTHDKLGVFPKGLCVTNASADMSLPVLGDLQ